MREIAFVSLDEFGKNKYVNDLMEIFAGYVRVNGYSIEDGVNKSINEKLIIVTDSIVITLIQPYIDRESKVIILGRTYPKDSLEELKMIPFGTKVLLANNCSSAAIDAISSLYKAGINHINFVPYYPTMKTNDEINKIDIAITPGKLNCVPENAKKIINIGVREIDVPTLLEISTTLDILDGRLRQRIYKYADYVGLSPGIIGVLKDINKSSNVQDIVLDEIDDGVLITDTDNRIIFYNKRILEILRIDSGDILNSDFNEIWPKDIFLDKSIINMDELEDYLIESDIINRMFLVTKRKIKIYGHDYGFMLVLKDLTNVKVIENRLRKHLKNKNYIAKHNFSDLKGNSKIWRNTIDKAKKIAKSDGTVLITGETGTGKELFAQSVHNYSNRAQNPFVALNCAALSAELLESELFGYEGGAFTGARKGGKKGLFECAHTGTIFLDEIGDMPYALQVKLLRVLEQQEIMRVGGTATISIDVRIIAATNKNIEDLIEKNQFREDLYYRLNVFNLFIPPLRERKEDIIYISEYFLLRLGYSEKTISDRLKEALIKGDWHGNVRELRNCIQYMAYMGGDVLDIDDLPHRMSELLKNEGLKNHKLPKTDKNEIHEEHMGFTLKGLTHKEKEVAKEMLEVLKIRNAGRRMLVDILNSNGVTTSEYEVRKIMDYLKKMDIIDFGQGREGAKLA